MFAHCKCSRHYTLTSIGVAVDVRGTERSLSKRLELTFTRRQHAGEEPRGFCRRGLVIVGSLSEFACCPRLGKVLVSDHSLTETVARNNQ